MLNFISITSVKMCVESSCVSIMCSCCCIIVCQHFPETEYQYICFPLVAAGCNCNQFRKAINKQLLVFTLTLLCASTFVSKCVWLTAKTRQETSTVLSESDKGQAKIIPQPCMERERRGAHMREWMRARRKGSMSEYQEHANLRLTIQKRLEKKKWQASADKSGL